VFAHMGTLNLVIMLKCFKVLLQWSKEVEIARYNVRAVWWLNETFPAKLLQELCCDTNCMRVSIVVEKDYFLYVFMFTLCTGVQLWA
jgi:hypothetical protein